MTRAQIEAILAGTKGVTPGPWTVGSWRDYVYSIAGENKWEPICRVQRNGDEATDDNRDVIDAAHIARLDPQTVSALCTALLESMDRVEELERYARDISKAAVQVRPLGGSELFTCIGGEHYADPAVIGDEIKRIKDALHEAKVAAVLARKSLGGCNG